MTKPVHCRARRPVLNKKYGLLANQHNRAVNAVPRSATEEEAAFQAMTSNAITSSDQKGAIDDAYTEYAMTELEAPPAYSPDDGARHVHPQYGAIDSTQATQLYGLPPSQDCNPEPPLVAATHDQPLLPPIQQPVRVNIIILKLGHFNEFLSLWSLACMECYTCTKFFCHYYVNKRHVYNSSRKIVGRGPTSDLTGGRVSHVH